MRKIPTQFGEALLAELEKNCVFIPKRFNENLMPILTEFNKELKTSSVALFRTGPKAGNYTPLEFRTIGIKTKSPQEANRKKRKNVEEISDDE